MTVVLLLEDRMRTRLTILALLFLVGVVSMMQAVGIDPAGVGVVIRRSVDVQFFGESR